MTKLRVPQLEQSLIDELLGALITVAADGQILSWNPAATALFGYSPDEVIGRSLFETIVPPEHAEDKRHWLASAMEVGSAIYEAVRVRKDGLRLYVDVSVKVVRNEAGEQFVVLNERVVTSIKYHREAQILQARFRGVLDAVPDAVVLLDEGGRIALANPQAERMFGYTRQELLGQTVELLIPERFRGIHPTHRTQYFLDPRSRPMGSGLELSARRKNGSEFPVEISLSPLSVDGVTLAISTIRDVSSRKKTEAKFRALLEAAPDAMVIVDRSGCITLVNSQTERLFGYPRAELIGKSVDILVPGRFGGAHPGSRADYFANLRARPMGSGLALSALRKDGTEFPVEISLSPVETDEGTLVTAAIRDISERIRLEDVRREVAERKHAQEVLGQHAAELARSNADLEQFAYVASHDLQEPLRMVASYTQLLAKRYRGRLDADADEFIGHAVDGVTRMQQLISDLLTYSRVGAQGKRFAPTDCEAVLGQVLSHLGPAVQSSGVEVTHDRLPTIMGDAIEIAQVLQNLIANAIKFRSQVSPRVHLTAERHGGEWSFAVSDNGIGIAPEHHERIFAMFQRLHSRTDYPGTGIGLAICKKIVERHGGRIWVTSQPEQGTTFGFTLPSVPADPGKITG